MEQALQAESKEVRTELAPGPIGPTVDGDIRQGAPSAAHLSVRFVGKATHAPVAKVRVAVYGTAEADGRQETKNVEGSRGDLHDVPISGALGVVEFDLPAEREFKLWARGEDDKSGEASAEIPRLHAGEQRELVLEIADGIDARVFGKLVCAETGEPVGGAHVSLEHTGAGMRVTSGGRPQLNRGKPASGGLTTGNDGTFELSCSVWAHPRLCVEAEGYGLRYVNLDGAHEDPAHPLVVFVSRAATLKARLLDASGAPIPQASVELKVTGYLLLHNEADEQGFYSSGAMNFPADEGWRVGTGADGRAEISGLPPRVEISLTLEKDGHTLQRDPQGLNLQPGEVKELEWRIGSGTLVRGLVLDQDGKPANGVEIWAAKAESGQRRSFLRYERDHIASKAKTDSEGRFELRELQAGTWCIGPGAVPDMQVISRAEILELAGEPTHELTLHVSRGLRIRGRVISPTGEPIPNARVTGRGAPNEFIEGVQGESDGSFSVGPLSPGAFSLTASGGRRFAPSDPVQANAGDVDVVLQLKRGGTIRGHVIDGVSGNSCAVQLTFAPEKPIQSEYANGMQTSTQEDGSFSISGLEPCPWSVVATSSDGRFAVQSHIEVGADTDSGDLVFTLTPGGKLKLSYKGSQQLLWVKILSQGALTSTGLSVRSGQSIECLAPAGSLVIETRLEYAGPARTKAVELAPGETKGIVLTDEDR